MHFVLHYLLLQNCSYFLVQILKPLHNIVPRRCYIIRCGCDGKSIPSILDPWIRIVLLVKPPYIFAGGWATRGRRDLDGLVVVFGKDTVRKHVTEAFSTWALIWSVCVKYTGPRISQVHCSLAIPYSAQNGDVNYSFNHVTPPTAYKPCLEFSMTQKELNNWDRSKFKHNLAYSE